MPDSGQQAVSSEQDRFTVRSFQGGDEQAILDLFNRSFPHAPRTVEHFRWKYQRDPFGNERISLAFDASGRLVGHYAGYAVPLYAGGEAMLAYQIGDTMTDPAVRHVGRGPTGILGRTALHFYQHFCQGHVAFNYGFNAANIQKFSMRFLRAERVEPVPYRILERARRASRWLRRMRGYQLEIVTDASPEFDELFARAAPHYRLLVRRDASYLAWRYGQSPSATYLVMAIRKWRRLVGWSVFRFRDDGRVMWGDALFDPRHAAAAAVLLHEVAGGREVECWFPARPEWFDEVLTGVGFERQREPHDLSLMVVPFAMAGAPKRIHQEMHYSMGDSDLF